MWKIQLWYSKAMMEIGKRLTAYHKVGHLVFYHGIKHCINAGVKRNRTLKGTKKND